MNEYTLSEISVGMSHEFQITITQEMQDNFRNLSGDVNPLHVDKKFAEKKGYKDIVVFGMLTASFYSQLVGVYLPGKNCLFHSIDTKFVKPCFIGDSLTISGKVLDIREKFKQLVIQAQIKNQDNDIVSKAKILVGVLDE